MVCGKYKTTTTQTLDHHQLRACHFLLTHRLCKPFLHEIKAMGVSTNAALAKLEVSSTEFVQDKLLQWVCHLAAPTQLKVEKEKKSVPLQLHTQGITLTQRNAVIRALCGMSLHGALDQPPYYLLGGGSLPLAAGGIVQYMSVADSLRIKAADLNTVLKELDVTLERDSFLLGSSQPTLADFDVALVLVDAKAEDLAPYPNVTRWRATVLWTFNATAPLEMAVLLEPSKSLPVPFFYNGTEDMGALLKPPPSKKAPANAVQKDTPSAANQKKGSAPKDAKKGKAETASKPAKPSGGGGNQNPDTYDISALDIRVGKIVKAWHHPEAEKLFCEEIDLGTETRQIASGLRPFYETSDLQDRHVLVLCNLKKRNLVGFASHGMVLCASNADHTAVEFVVPPADSVQLGERVIFEGYEGDAQPENKVAKKKIFEGLAPDLKTDGSGQVVWKNALAKTSGGIVKALNGMPNASVS
jgi:methionine--tRNA ligase beta chain